MVHLLLLLIRLLLRPLFGDECLPDNVPGILTDSIPATLTGITQGAEQRHLLPL